MKLTCIRGTTEECLKHFSKQLGNNYERRHAICTLVGVHKKTGHDWFVQNTLPVGVNLLSLRSLLSVLGYGVSELDNLSPNIRICAEALGFRAAVLDELVNVTKRDRVTVLSILIKGSNTSKDVRDKMAAFAEGIQSRVNQSRTAWAKELGTNLNATSLAPTTQEKANGQPVQPDDRQQVITSLSHMVMATLTLAEKVAGDEFTADDRQKLRQLTATQRGHSSGVFELYQALGALCSERARNHQNS